VKVLFGHVSLEVEYQQIRKCIQIGLDCVKIDRFKWPTISQIIKTSRTGKCRFQQYKRGKVTGRHGFIIYNLELRLWTVNFNGYHDILVLRAPQGSF
jgi:hypothetical protein